MKGLVFYGLVFCTVLSSKAFAQEFEVPITVSDNTHSAVLTIGVHLNGTDGFDSGLDLFAPPPPPAGSFDRRSVIGGESFITDIRDNATSEKVFHVQYQPASGQEPIVLTWDSTGLSMLGSFFITDDITGELFGPLDMTTTDRLDVSTTGGLLDDGLRVLVTPASPQENNAPVTLDDEATTDEDTVLDIDVLANDTDPDGDMLTVTQVSDPPNGTASINTDGTVRYQPDADFNGADSLTYVVDDVNGESDQATVRIDTMPVNDAPIFTSTPLTSASEGQPYSYTATAMDIEGTPLTFTPPTLPSWLNFSDQGDGTATLTGTPSGSDLGEHATVIEASDGVDMNQQAFTITVSSEPNQIPAPQDDEATTDEDMALDIDVLANDTDPDGDMLTVTQVSDPPNGTASINANGTVRYQPDADFHGTDGLTYTVSDPGGLTAQRIVTVTITSVNDAPVFTSTPVTEATPNASFSYAIMATDIDGDGLTVTAPTRPPWLAFVDHADGTAMLEGTPEQADAGSHDVLIEVTDGVETTQQALTLVVTDAMNLPPSATAPTIPADGTTVQLEGNPDADFIVEWNAASDPEGAVVSYRWELSLTQSFSSLLFNEDVGTTTRFETTVGAVATALTRAGIPVGSALTMFHRVVTSDGTNETVGPVYAVTLMRGVLVGVETEAQPGRFALLGNYPNPFNPETVIRYALAEATNVHLAVYDASGRKVAVLVDEAQQAGYHERTFNASSLRSGTYFYRLRTKHFHQVKGMIFMK